MGYEKERSEVMLPNGHISHGFMKTEKGDEYEEIEQLHAYTEPIVSAVNQLQKATDPSTYAVMQISEQWKRHYEINIKPAIQAINMNYPSFSKVTESLRSMSLPLEKMVSATKEIADKTNIGDTEE